MNKDDMSDDAQFEAFLNGEGDLARRLQGLSQPGPSAALDAAILANARAAMAQEPRVQAANDSGASTPAPRLSGMGWRWRVPAGIAATVLVGVIARQAFESGGQLNDTSLPPATREEAPAVMVDLPPPPPPPSALNVPQVEESQTQPAIVAPAAAPVMQDRYSEPAAAAPQKMAPTETVQSETQPSLTMPKPELLKRAPEPSADQTAVPVVAPAPAAAPAMERPAPAMERPAPAPSAESAPMAERRAPARAPAPAAPAATAPVAAPAPAPAAPVLNYNEVPGAYSRAQPRASAPAPKIVLDNEESDQRLSQSVQIKGSRVKANAVARNEAELAGAMGGKTLPNAQEWLDRIEKLLAEGKQAEALASWKKFRVAYPDYPVTDATLEKLK